MDSQQNKDANSNQPTGPQFEEDRGGRILGGIIVIAVGGALLASRLGVELPRWLFHWAMIPIIIGIYIGARHKFRSFGWLIPVAIGAVLLVDDYTMLSIREYIWPMIIILVGFAIMFKPRHRGRWQKEVWDRRRNRWNNVTDVNPVANTASGNVFNTGSSTTPGTGEDMIDAVTIFGSLKKNIISKDFRGGDAVTFFGGTELNMLQADINGHIVLELTQVFAGAKLVVPPHWRIQTTDVVSIFGGIEDKRPLPAEGSTDPMKVVVIKGVCLFGGIDIKSF